MAPLLFLIMGEALHATIHQAQEQGNIKGVQLPKSDDQQLTLQFVDDTSFTVRAKHASVFNLVSILQSFTLASGLLINWEKSGAYWAGSTRPPPDWANAFSWTWGAKGNITKLLGTPFGLTLSTTDSDQFLLDKIKSKLTY